MPRLSSILWNILFDSGVDHGNAIDFKLQVFLIRQVSF